MTVPVGMEVLVYLRLIMINLVLCLHVIFSSIDSFKKMYVLICFKLPRHFFFFS